jgi:hypothetical protein
MIDELKRTQKESEYVCHTCNIKFGHSNVTASNNFTHIYTSPTIAFFTFADKDKLLLLIHNFTAA